MLCLRTVRECSWTAVFENFEIRRIEIPNLEIFRRHHTEYLKVIPAMHLMFPLCDRQTSIQTLPEMLGFVT